MGLQDGGRYATFTVTPSGSDWILGRLRKAWKTNLLKVRAEHGIPAQGMKADLPFAVSTQLCARGRM